MIWVIFRAVLEVEDGGVRLCSKKTGQRIMVGSKSVVSQSKVLQQMSPSG